VTPHKLAFAAAISLLVVEPVMAAPPGTQPAPPAATSAKEAKPSTPAKDSKPSTAAPAPQASVTPSTPAKDAKSATTATSPAPGSTRPVTTTATPPASKPVAPPASPPPATAKPAAVATPAGERPTAEKPPEKAGEKPADKVAGEKPTGERKTPARRPHRTARRARGPLDPAGEVRLLPSADSFIALVDATRTEARPLVLHFWASWCEICKGELPSLGDAFQQLEESGLRVLVVSLDDPAERSGPVRRFLDQHDIAGERYLLDTYDPALVTNRIDPAWKGELPATFVLREGQQVFRYIGPMEELKPMMEAIDAADGVQPAAEEEPAAESVDDAPPAAVEPAPPAGSPPPAAP